MGKKYLNRLLARAAQNRVAQNRAGRRRGVAMLEFTLLGIPAIFLFIAVVTCSIDMWQFFTLSYAVDQTARYTALHGATCTQNGNTCQITRADAAAYFQAAALALNPASTTMILTDNSGSVTCSPVTACPSSTSFFPAVGSNTPVTNNVTVQARYALINPMAMFWPGGGTVAAGNFTVTAKSTQEILF